MAAKTKAELERTIKALKDEVRELRSNAKGVSEEISNFPNKAIGVTLEDGEYSIVTIMFDVEKNSAVIKDTTPTKKHRMMTSSLLKTAIIDELIHISKGDK